MDIIEAIQKRKSVRDFTNDEISKATLREILEIAGRAPSAMNTQPWEFTVITKGVLNSVRNAVIKNFRDSKKPLSPNSPIRWPQDSIYRIRQVDLAKQIYQLLDIKREEKEKRIQWMERGLRFFDAPAAIIICIDQMIDHEKVLFDIGAVSQNICLLALHYGLATCIEDQGVMYPEILRHHCGIPDSKKIIVAIAIGYPNWNYPVNHLISPRESVDRKIAWYGFDEIV